MTLRSIKQVLSIVQRLLALALLGGFFVSISVPSGLAADKHAPTSTPENKLPSILTEQTPYLPDYSYAGYRQGEEPPVLTHWQTYDAKKHRVKPDDGRDDTQALLKLLDQVHKTDEPAIIQLPPGRIILSDIIYIERSNIILRGAGSGQGGTNLYFPRPLMYLEPPKALHELQEYLAVENKRQSTKRLNTNLPYSLYTWSGGYVWTQVPGERVKPYLDKYAGSPTMLATPKAGKRGERSLVVDNTKHLNIGDVVQLTWYNKRGQQAKIIKDLYPNKNLDVGSHHWTKPDQPIVRQQIEITHIQNNTLTFASPLLLDVNEHYDVALIEWKHLTQVGIEHLSFEFPLTADIDHHVEQGSNAMYLTRLYNSWVRDVRIINADSGILTESIANTTINDVTTTGKKLAHYTVQMGANHNVLVSDLRVENPSRHAMSFNTGCTKSVYTNSEIMQTPMFDQHSGANMQNLFDNIKVHVALDSTKPPFSHHLFKGGGAPYWFPATGPYNTFWNIHVHFENGLHRKEPVILNGEEQASETRIIGLYGNKDITLDYGIAPYVSHLNQRIDSVRSLYLHQRLTRMNKK